MTNYFKTIFICLLILTAALFSSCTKDNNSYQKAMETCMQSVTERDITLTETGEIGKSYNGFDPQCLVGAQLPEFTTTDIEDHGFSTQQLKGSINVIDFWFVACRPCIKKIPELNALVSSYGNSEVNYLSVSRDDESTLRTFLSSNDFQFTHLLDGKNLIANTFKYIGSYPFMLVTDKNLKIVKVLHGRQTTVPQIEKSIESLL